MESPPTLCLRQVLRVAISSGTLLLFALVPLRVASADEPARPRANEYSLLWGRDGERWDPRGRLPDFSYAGYHRGEQELPRRRADVSVRDFGAVGDGEADDTEAFQKAIDASPGKVIAVPAGRYRITDFVTIARSGTVLQGDGPDRSTLYFPITLNEVRPDWGATTTGRRTSNYSWSGGFLVVAGSWVTSPLAAVTAAARRGDLVLTVSGVNRLSVGQEVALRLNDDERRSLTRHLYDDDPGPIENLQAVRETFAFRVTAIDSAARRVTIDRPLRTDARLEWQPKLTSGTSSVEEVGIEGLAFEFPEQPYGGHFTELGYNAIALKGVRNCWLRDLHVRNADSGLFVSGVNVTLRGLRLSSRRAPEPRRMATGHHGVTLNGQDQLLTDFTFETRFMHDITLTRGSAGNVVTSGRGVDLCFDHHCYAPHANLFTDVDLGAGTRMFQSGGGAKLGRHCAAFGTFWNIRSGAPQTWPAGWSPDRIQLIGVATREASTLDPNGRWLEAIPPERLQPANLHAAQLARRLHKNEAK